MKGCKFLQTRTTTIQAAANNVLICNCYAHAGYDILMLCMMLMLHMMLMPSVFHVLRICTQHMLHMCIYVSYMSKHRFSSYNVYAYDAPHPHISCDKKPKGPRTELPINCCLTELCFLFGWVVTMLLIFISLCNSCTYLQNVNMKNTLLAVFKYVKFLQLFIKKSYTNSS